jgi:exopolysaccharide biosynthesis polyprenyl glycosylphosphotransferase
MNDRHQFAVAMLKVCDIGAVILAFTTATIVIVKSRSEITLEQFFSLRTRASNFFIFAFVLLLVHIVLVLYGLYQSRRLMPLWTEAIDVTKAMTLTTCIFAAVGWSFSIRMITTQFLAIFWFLCVAIVWSNRFLLRSIAANLRSHGKDLRYMLILGTNTRALDFAREITDHPKVGFKVLGFVDDPWPGISKVQESPFRVVSDFRGLAEYLRNNVIDEVSIHLPFGSFYKHSSEVVSLCAQHGIMMRYSTDLFHLSGTKWRSELFDGVEYITTLNVRESLAHDMKRLFDIVVASGALLALMPILVLAAISIKVTSPGPIFFLQERVGLNKRRFKIIKFRTMVPDAEKMIAALEERNEAQGPVFKIKDDPRITAIGKFLRKSSIDELPQLINVLKGEMSLVGPRPLPIRDYQGFSEDWQRRRFSAKPGITCLWQVGGRSGIPFEQWMRLDLEYLDGWSLWLDLKILAKTVPAVIRSSGAV